MKDISELFSNNRWGLYDLDDDKDVKMAFENILKSRIAFDTGWVSPDETMTGFRIYRPRKNGMITIEVSREMDDWDDDIIGDAAASLYREDELDQWYDSNRINIDKWSRSWQMSETYEKWVASIQEACYDLGNGNTSTRTGRTIPSNADIEAISLTIDELDNITDDDLKATFETIKKTVNEHLDLVKKGEWK